jgi:hypothetical protein
MYTDIQILVIAGNKICYYSDPMQKPAITVNSNRLKEATEKVGIGPGTHGDGSFV